MHEQDTIVFEDRSYWARMLYHGDPQGLAPHEVEECDHMLARHGVSRDTHVCTDVSEPFVGTRPDGAPGTWGLCRYTFARRQRHTA